jgi:hypothetical protein
MTLLYFLYWQKKLATFNPLPIFPCNGSVTITSYFLKCYEIVTSYYKKVTSYKEETLLRLHLLVTALKRYFFYIKVVI